MNPISEDMEKAFHPVQLKLDEYLDQATNLICCGKCHTPRQHRFESNGTTFAPRCMCACMTKEYEKKEQERRHREFLDMVARNRNVGLPDPAQRKHTFENDLGYNPKQMAMAKNYVLHWDELRKDSMGLLFWGCVGTGKSYIAGCIANALLDKGIPVMMTNFTRLLNKLTDMYSGDRNAYIDSFNSYPLLIIDDLGVERKSEFAREQVFNVIDSRYRSQLPLIVTTNLTLGDLKEPENLAQARIYDRVLERCTPILVKDQNIRKLNTAANMVKAKSFLEG